MSPAHEADELFARTYGGARPEVRASAPGRVNVIGEHTDYNGGFVLPIAIEKRTHVVGIRRAHGDVCRIVSTHDGGERVYFAANATLVPGAPAWANYVKGVVAQYLPDLPGGMASFDIAIASDVPLGGGLSSSAALEVAVATFLETAYGLRVDPKTRALRCQKCEHDFAGVPCGIMDQMVSSCGQSGHALLIDCIPPFATKLVALDDPSVVFVVANSNVKHQLEGSEYATRVQECRTAAAVIRKRFPQSGGVESSAAPLLRGATMTELLACKDQMSVLEFQRARHIIGEDARTLDCVDALVRRDYATAGRLMVESHNSLRDDYQVSTAELDALVEIAMRVDGPTELDRQLRRRRRARRHVRRPAARAPRLSEVPRAALPRV
ncbi:ribosomal protein S5 domain 2-type protein [Pavlovales sp. CCMP2436]|nr:ribosomal protein S5 domain 2-type protein [Pavlovales sp. CCMP2436]